MKILYIILLIFLIFNSCTHDYKNEQIDNTKIFNEVSYELLNKYMFLLFYSPPFPPGYVSDIFKNKKDSIKKIDFIRTFKPYNFEKLNANNEYEFDDFFWNKRQILLFGKKVIGVTDTLSQIDESIIKNLENKDPSIFSGFNIKSTNVNNFYKYNSFSTYEYCFVTKTKLDTIKDFTKFAGDLNLSNIFYNNERMKAFFICEYKFEPILSIKEIIFIEKRDCYWKIYDRFPIGGHNFIIQ